MKRKWENEELTEHWSLDSQERERIAQKRNGCKSNLLPANVSPSSN